MDMGSYTQHKYDDLINAAEGSYDIDCDYDMLLKQLNSADFFAPFSERMRRFISKREGKDFSPRDAYNFLKGKMKEAGLSPNRNTIKNWLNVRDDSEGNSGPNMGDDGREAMFQVAFSLGLNASETEDFFHRVYLDKAFNPRNLREFVYLYCLLRGKSYLEAQDLIIKAMQILSYDQDSDVASATIQIKSAAQSAKDEEELLSYIGEHSFNFTRKNETALATLNRILKDLKGDDENKGLAEQEYDAYKDDDLKGSEGRNLHSVNFVLDLAENGPQMAGIAAKEPNAKRARDILTRKEISNQFPNANTISHPDSSYILRKNIILLYFYWYWVKDYLKGYPDGDDESFVTELNNILFNCGFGPLYYGNPYDWLFLYCSSCEINGTSPLDVLRGILANDEDDGSD